MNDYLVMPEKGHFYKVRATTFEMAYAGVCCWYNPKRRVAIINVATKETKIYTRELNKHGNLICIIEN